ncbi:AAA family ATPase [Xylophilus sp.]|uniref:AAA family ATPase n=1 Tax=Xylophilus sp. TaxID=2653893 RepID=UPI0013BA5EDF|nr:AAA family ATPase [Xylophilus sp.]KAF1049166.1 MAG: hypothetical protein GAK38_00934 [Xylophilus sp.]
MSGGEVIVLNGPAGVGTTTVASRIAVRRPGTVNIAGDLLRGFLPGDARGHLGAGPTYRAGAALAQAYLDMGAPRVLFDYVFNDAGAIGVFRRGLRPGTPVHVCTLWAPLEVVQRRERTREGREPLGERVTHTWAALDRNRHALGTVIHNTGAPDDAAAEILRSIAAGGP